MDTSAALKFSGDMLKPGIMYVVTGMLFDQDQRPFACLKMAFDFVNMKPASG